MKFAVTGLATELEVDVREIPGGRYRVRVAPRGEAGKEYDVGWGAGPGVSHRVLEWEGRRHPVAVEPEGEALGVTIGIDHFDLRIDPLGPLPRRERTTTPTAGALEVRAPMPGLVVAVEVTPGQGVGAGATVAVIEAMKMQMELRAPADGVVGQVLTAAGREVAAGEVIVTLVPAGGAAPRA